MSKAYSLTSSIIRVEGTVIIIAACLPTLRPVFLFVTGQPGTRNSGKRTPTQSSDYQLHSYSQDKKTPARRARDPYPVDTTGVGDADSMEDHILPPENAIRKTDEVHVYHEQAEPAGLHVGSLTPLGNKTPVPRRSEERERGGVAVWRPPTLYHERR